MGDSLRCLNQDFYAEESTLLEPVAFEAWLVAANRLYRGAGVEHRQRPFRALADYAKEFKCTVEFGSPVARTIFDFFKANSPEGAHTVGALFVGAFPFDSCFWPTQVLIGYGATSVNPFDALDTMPITVKRELVSNPLMHAQYLMHWADCYDYAYGLDDIWKRRDIGERAMAFVRNGDSELTGAIAQLLPPRPNAKAILGLRMTVEIFLKALLIQENGFSEQQLKKLSHRIEDIAKECFELTGERTFETVMDQARIFPPRV